MKQIEPLVKGDGPQGPWYRIAAKPATCVRLALASLLKEKPDVVVSGINRGDNAGLTVYVSGTLGAAREAAFDGMPAVAASLMMPARWTTRPGAAVLGRIVAAILKRGLPKGTFLSVNIPATEIKGVKVVPHSLRAGVNTYDRAEPPTEDQPTSGTCGPSPGPGPRDRRGGDPRGLRHGDPAAHRRQRPGDAAGDRGLGPSLSHGPGY